VFGLGAGVIASLFASGALWVLARTLIRLSVVFLVADAASVIARAVLRGAGDVRYPAVVGVLTAWAMTPPTTWLLGLHFGWGAAGGWIGLSAEIILGAALFWRRLISGGWREAAAASRRSVAAGAGHEIDESHESHQSDKATATADVA
jgi:MATE family multidrug resistance protein